jgi:hypothetical protein
VFSRDRHKGTKTPRFTKSFLGAPLGLGVFVAIPQQHTPPPTKLAGSFHDGAMAMIESRALGGAIIIQQFKSI